MDDHHNGNWSRRRRRRHFATYFYIRVVWFGCSLLGVRYLSTFLVCIVSCVGWFLFLLLCIVVVVVQEEEKEEEECMDVIPGKCRWCCVFVFSCFVRSIIFYPSNEQATHLHCMHKHTPNKILYSLAKSTYWCTSSNENVRTMEVLYPSLFFFFGHVDPNLFMRWTSDVAQKNRSCISFSPRRSEVR